MPALLLVRVLLLAGCVPRRAAPDGVPTADAPFRLLELYVGEATRLFRCQHIYTSSWTVHVA
jgi:hypothetical protein